MIVSSGVRRFIHFIPILLLILTFVVRVYRLDAIQFDSDFGRDSLFGWRILTEKITLLGAQASVGGFYLGPGYFYFIALIFSIFGPLPEMMMISFAILNTAAAAIGFHFLRTRSGYLSGILFLLLFSSNPLLIEASRMATHAPMLPFITVTSLLFLFTAIEKQSRWHFLVAGISLGLFLHVHFSALLLFPGIFLIVWLYTVGSIKKKIESLLLYVLGIGLLCLPLILFDIRHGFLTSKAFLQYGLSVVQGSQIRDAFPHWSLSEKVIYFGNYLASSPRMLFFLAGVLAVGIWSLIHMKSAQKKTSGIQILILCVSVFLLLLLYPGYLFPYYLIVPGTLLVLTFSMVLSFVPIRVVGIIIALAMTGTQLSRLGPQYKPQFRTLQNLTQISHLIEGHLQKNPKPFALYKDSSDRLTGLGYEYRFLLTKDGYTPVHETTYDQAEVLYVIREEGNGDPLTIGGHEMSQFRARTSQTIGSLKFHDRDVTVFALSK